MSLNVGGDYACGQDRGERQVASGDLKLSWTPLPDSYDLFELSGEFLWGQNNGTFSGDRHMDQAGALEVKGLVLSDDYGDGSGDFIFRPRSPASRSRGASVRRRKRVARGKARQRE